MPTSAETPDLVDPEVPPPKSSDPSIGLTPVAGQNHATTVHEDASAGVVLERLKVCLSQADHPVCPVQLAHVTQLNVSEREGPTEPEVIEENDVDLEDRPLTVVNVPQETEAVTDPASTVPTSVECKSKQLSEEKSELFLCPDCFHYSTIPIDFVLELLDLMDHQFSPFNLLWSL